MDSVKLCLTGKKALVAGDGRLGAKYTTVTLAESGADVVVAGHNKLNPAAAAVRNYGKEALSIEVDVIRMFQAQSMAEQRPDHFGLNDIPVNSADIREDITVDAIGAGWMSESVRTGIYQEDLLLKHTFKTLWQSRRNRLSEGLPGFRQLGIDNRRIYHG
jgi:NAD(P)-dependent dehydrogenase (short-subunit alcohol dehydrogenase family)